MLYGPVLHRKRDVNGHLIGKSDSNPILDTSAYEIMFKNGHVKAYKANLIAELKHRLVQRGVNCVPRFYTNALVVPTGRAKVSWGVSRRTIERKNMTTQVFLWLYVS
jgi:hypothetical protein